MDVFKNAKSDILFGCIFLLISLASIFGGVYMYVQNGKAYDNYVKTEAVIADYEVRKSYDDGDYKEYITAIMQYVVEDKIYTHRRSVESVKIGEKVEIYYNPDNPEEVIMPQKNSESAKLLFAFGVMALLGGLVFFICGIKVRLKGKSDMVIAQVEETDDI